MGRLVFVAGLAVSTFTSQAAWLTFAPVSTRVAEDLGVSPEAVGLLAVMYPAFYLLLTLPSGALIDRDVRLWASAGAVLTGLGASLRLLDPLDYRWLAICQALAAAGQPFLLNSFAAVAGSLFPERKGMVVSILSLSMYMGIIYSLATGYRVYEALGVVGLVAPVAVASLVGALLSIAGAARLGRVSGQAGGRWRLRDALSKDIVLLGLLVGLGIAIFDNMSIWLEAALSPAGLGDVAGVAVAASLVSGLIGVALIPGVVAGRGLRTIYFRLAAATAAIIFLTLALAPSRASLLVLMVLLGLVMLPAYPLVMEWIATFHDRRVHGSAAGLVGLVSRILTTTLALAAPLFIGSPSTYFMYLALLAAAALVVALMLPGDR